MDLVVEYFFANSLHTAVTLILLFGLPEMYLWRRDKFANTRWSNQTIVLLGFSIIFVMAILQTTSFKDQFFVEKIFYLLVYLRSIHVTAQFRGLSSLYNQRAKANLVFSPMELKKFQRHERIEKALFQTLQLCAVIISFSLVIPYQVDRWFLYLGLTVASGILINGLLFPKASLSNKSIFQLRVFFVPLLLTGFLPFYWILAVVHGTEYMLLSFGMLKRSQAPFAKSLPRVLGIYTVFLAVAAVGFMPVHFQQISWMIFDAHFITGLLWVQFVIEFGHYFIDALIFRFRDPSVVRSVGKLI